MIARPEQRNALKTTDVDSKDRIASKAIKKQQQTFASRVQISRSMGCTGSKQFERMEQSERMELTVERQEGRWGR